MGSQDDFFEALGPTPDPPNVSPGFFTHASGLHRGVDVAGKMLGVRGTGTDPGAAGVIGEGGVGDNVTPGGNGVFGHGMNGVVGYSATAARIMATEFSEPAGVFGVGDGSSAVGVRGESVGPNAGVKGPGITGHSVDSQGGVFDSVKNAQLLLVPIENLEPTQLSQSDAGALAAAITLDERGNKVASLWFCTVGGVPGKSKWTKIA